MPQKKSSGGKKEQQGAGTQVKAPAEPTLVSVDGDPVSYLVSIVDKKARNLEKRKNKLTALKESNKGELDKDQKEAITKIQDVGLQLELIRDLQKQFSQAEAEITKTKKKQQKAEKLQAKEAEHVARQKAVAYALRVTDILNTVGDDDKENFKNGSEGATKLTDEELTQVDELYKLVVPSRAGNASFETEITDASEHLLSLMDGSPKEVAGTTYKELQGVIQKMDSCGYFDLEPPPLPEEESEDDAEEEEYKSADDQPQDDAAQDLQGEAVPETYTEEVDIPPEVPPTVEAENPPDQLVAPINPEPPLERTPVEPTPVMVSSPPIMTQTSGIMGYMPNAPSPTFPALQGSSPVLMSHEGGSFSFMHDSKLDRGQPTQSAIAPPPGHPSIASTVQPPGHQSPLSPPPTQIMQSPVQPHPPPVQQPLPPPSQPQVMQPPPHAMQTYQFDSRASEGVVSAGGETEGIGHNTDSVMKPPSGQGTTDVATGQPNPSVPQQQQYAARVSTMDTVTTAPPSLPGGGMMSSSGGELINQDMGGVRGGGSNPVPVMYSSVLPNNGGQSHFNNRPPPQQPQQHQQQLHQGQSNAYYKGPPQHRRDNNRGGYNQGGNGGRRINSGGWGQDRRNNNNNYSVNKGNRGGMDGHGSRNFGGGGSGYPQHPRTGGRPNYRTNGGGGGGQSSGGPRRAQ